MAGLGVICTYTNITLKIHIYKRLCNNNLRTFIIANNHTLREVQNIFFRKHDGEQANESLLTWVDVAAIIMSRNKFCYLLIFVKYRGWNESNGGIHMEIWFLSVWQTMKDLELLWYAITDISWENLWNLLHVHCWSICTYNNTFLILPIILISSENSMNEAIFYVWV